MDYDASVSACVSDGATLPRFQDQQEWDGLMEIAEKGGRVLIIL